LDSSSDAAALIAQQGEEGCSAIMRAGDVSSGGVTISGITFEDDLGRSFDAICSRLSERPPAITVQRELIAQLVGHPGQRDAILVMWRGIYKADNWIDRVEAALERSTA
jgi:hypothetical protein